MIRHRRKTAAKKSTKKGTTYVARYHSRFSKWGATNYNNKIYRFVRTTDGTNFTYVNAGTETNWGSRFLSQVANANNNVSFEFRLQDVPNYTEFTTLFDQYRIDKITFKMIPMCNVNQLTIASAGTFVNNPGIVGTVIDYDDANILSTLASFEQYANFRFQPVVSSKTIQRTFKPHIAVAAFGGGVFTSYMNKGPTWIDCNNATVAHYAIKIYLDGPDGTAPTAFQKFQLFATYYLSFRNVR